MPVVVCHTCDTRYEAERGQAEQEAKDHKEWHPDHHVTVDGDPVSAREVRA